MLEDLMLSIFIYFALIGIFLFITLSLFLLTLKQDKKDATKRKQERSSVPPTSSSRQFRTFGSRRSRNDKTGIF
jgi:hypothetical protein